MLDFTNEEEIDKGYNLALDLEEQDITREKIVQTLVHGVASVLDSSFYRDERNRVRAEIMEFLEMV